MSRIRLLTTTVAAIGAAAVALGVFTVVNGASTATLSAPDAPGTTPVLAPGTYPEPKLAPRTPGAPRTLRIPALGVSAPILPVRSVGSTLVPPRDPQSVGWWADGARPGAETGSALLAGHSVRNGDGALDLLGDLDPGDLVKIQDGDGGTVSYSVDRVRTYGKGIIAQDAERLFSQDVRGRLVLVTCADWDGTQYLSNTVAIARPVRTT